MTAFANPAAGALDTDAPHRPGENLVSLDRGRALGRYRRRGHWAVTWGGVSARPADAEIGLSHYLEVLRSRRLRPLFLGVPDRRPFARRGLYTRPYAQEAVLDLTGIDLSADRYRETMLAVGSAEQSGLLVLPYRPVLEPQVARLVAVDALHRPSVEGWVAVDGDGAVQGVTAWELDGLPGAGAVVRDAGSLWRLRLAAVAPGGDGRSVLGMLIADAISEYRWRGVRALALGFRPVSRHWPVPSQNAVPAARAVVDGFHPDWRTRWLAMPSWWQTPSAVMALR